MLVAGTLAGCALSGGPASFSDPVSGGKSATVALSALAKASDEKVRPSGAMGIFATMYLAQGFFLPTQSAVQGLQEILRIVRDQEKPLNDATFALLQTLGDVLTADIVDVLNRSTDRIGTLNRYFASLENVIVASRQKSDEIAAALKALSAQKKERRTLVNTLTREQKAAIAAKDYATAARKDEELLAAGTALSETERTESQTKDMQSRLKKMLDVAEKRKTAIEKNRELLLAGLRVADLPGLEDLGIIEKETRRR